MTIIDCIQGSDEWFTAKRGKVTASHFSEILNTGSGRKTYMMRVIAERLTGITQTGYQDKNMEGGIELEPQAKVYYEELNECKVESVGFIAKNDFVGCSPDGLVSKEGLVEIKCPLTTTHLNYILKGKMPAIYKPQVQGGMFVTGRKWCDFVSFDPLLKQHPFFCTRVFRDDKYIMVLELAIEQFLKELQEIIQKVKGECYEDSKQNSTGTESSKRPV